MILRYGFLTPLLLSMHSINPFSGSVVGIIHSHASLYFVYVTNALSGYVIIYSVGGFLLGRRQNGLSGKVINWRERERANTFFRDRIHQKQCLSFCSFVSMFQVYYCRLSFSSLLGVGIHVGGWISLGNTRGCSDSSAKL